MLRDMNRERRPRIEHRHAPRIVHRTHNRALRRMPSHHRPELLLRRERQHVRLLLYASIRPPIRTSRVPQPHRAVRMRRRDQLRACLHI